MAVSAVQTGENTAQMLSMTGAGGNGPGNCDGCGGGDDDTKAVTCAPALTCASMAAVLPAERGIAPPRSALAFVPLSIAAHSLIAPPEPYPPRSLEVS